MLNWILQLFGVFYFKKIAIWFETSGKINWKSRADTSISEIREQPPKPAEMGKLFFGLLINGILTKFYKPLGLFPSFVLLFVWSFDCLWTEASQSRRSLPPKKLDKLDFKQTQPGYKRREGEASRLCSCFWRTPVFGAADIYLFILFIFIFFSGEGGALLMALLAG